VTVLWLSAPVATCILIAVALLARKIPRRGPRRMLLPAWVVIGSLFFACAEDVHGVYLWILGQNPWDEWRHEFSESADEWRVKASRRAFIAVALAIAAIGFKRPCDATPQFERF
jgi:hypothetical protein